MGRVVTIASGALRACGEVTGVEVRIFVGRRCSCQWYLGWGMRGLGPRQQDSPSGISDTHLFVQEQQRPVGLVVAGLETYARYGWQQRMLQLDYQGGMPWVSKEQLTVFD